jgi:hypothetical protein
MAEVFKGKMDVSGGLAGLEHLRGALRESLARRMLVSGGQILRDEAQRRVPDKFKGEYNETSRGSHASGTLKNAIYLAYNDRLSTTVQFTYSVSWNAQKAWWGKLIEFGHFIRYAWFVDEKGVYHTIKTKPLKAPIWINATPFLAPAYDARIQDVRRAMIDRGRQELPQLLREAKP